MENHDHNIIGRAFEYYNNREENPGRQLDVKAYHKLTEPGLLAEGGIYHDIQRRKNNNTTNNQILSAIFFVLKESVQNPNYAGKLKTQKDVYKAIEGYLGKLKVKIQTNLAEVLNAKVALKKVTPNVKKESGLVVNAKAVTPTTKKETLQTDKTLEVEPVVAEAVLEVVHKPTPVRKTPKTTRLPKEERIKSYFVNSPDTKKTQKTGTIHTNGNRSSKAEKSKSPVIVAQKDSKKDIAKSDSFVVNPEYTVLLDTVKKARTSQEKKTLLLKLFDILNNDTEKYGFQNDKKIGLFKYNIKNFIKENSFDTALAYELKFFAFRIERLGKNPPKEDIKDEDLGD